MSQFRNHQLYEADWDTKICKAINGNQAKLPVLTVCGPSGVGKSTVVVALSQIYPVYLEDVTDNPYLKGLLTGSGHFDAMANQQWFLDQIGNYVNRADPRSPLILDQDPAAIVLAYSRLFLEDGKITDLQYTSLLGRLLQVEEALTAWKYPRTVLFLDAPGDVLHMRVLKRWGEILTPPLAWFEKIRDKFLDICTRYPEVVTVSTIDLTPEQIVVRIKSLMRENGVDQV